MSNPLKSLIQKAEQRLKIDIHYLLHGSFWMLIAQGFGFLLSFALMLFFTNLVSRETYGEYRFLISAISFLGIVALPSLGHAYLRAAARGQSGVLFDVIKKKLQYGLLSSLLAIGTALYYFHLGNERLVFLFILLAITVPFFDLHAIYGTHLSGNKDFKTLSIFATIQRAIVVLSLIGSIIISGKTVLLFITFLTATIVTNYIFFRLAVAKYPPSKEKDPDTIPYGIHLSVAGALQQGANYLDKIILWKVAGPATVAMQTISVALPQEIGSALSQVNGIALPKMATRNLSELRQSLPRKFIIFLVGTIPFVLLYIFAAPYLFEFFFPKYLDTLPYVFAASFLIFSAPVTFLTQYFYASKYTKAIYWVQITESVSLILLIVLLIPPFGVTGAILALDFKILITFLLSVIMIYLDKRADHTAIA